MYVTYIDHSGFLIELANYLLLFDFNQGTLPILDKNKPLYIFISHHHNDHFNPTIFSLKHPSIHYILSNDITDFPNQNITIVDSNNAYQIDSLWIETLTSTDEGVAFMIECDHKK